jgi:hypothetical protein
VNRQNKIYTDEFSLILKPNYETVSERTHEVIDAALVHQVDTVGRTVAEGVAHEVPKVDAERWARAYYADADPEIAGVLERLDPGPGGADEVNAAVLDLFEMVDIAYCEADAAEVTSLELDKVAGVEAALSVLGVEDPLALVMGDSKFDLRVMECVYERDASMGGAPRRATPPSRGSKSPRDRRPPIRPGGRRHAAADGVRAEPAGGAGRLTRIEHTGLLKPRLPRPSERGSPGADRAGPEVPPADGGEAAINGVNAEVFLRVFCE